MVSHYRLRAVLLPLMLYCVTGAIGSYFVWHAAHGQRGLVAKAEYKRQMAALAGELAGLQGQKAQWSLRVGLIRGEAIDRDILDEEARLILDRVDKRDLAVFLPPPGAR